MGTLHLLLSILILVISFSSIECENVTEGADNATIAQLTRLLSNIPAFYNDCDAKATRDDLSWIVGNELVNKDTPLWKSRTNLPRLRRFLLHPVVQYHLNPGSIRFVNYQDLSISLECAPESAPYDGYEWTVQGTNDDKKFNEEKHVKRKIVETSPLPYMYFRKYICKNKGKKCTHYIYVFTRPQPIIEPRSLHYRQGQDFEFKCSLSSCLYNGNEEDRNCRSTIDEHYKKHIKFYQPSDFYWTIEHEESGTRTNIPHDEVHLPKKIAHLHMEVKFAKANITDKAKNIFAQTPSTVHQLIPFVHESNISVTNVTKAAAGKYECVIVDENGIPSTPSAPLRGHSGAPFSGIVHLHVREWFWIYVPICIIGGVLLLTLLLICLCPRHMEHDDGTPYTKAEMDENFFHAHLAHIGADSGETEPASEGELPQHPRRSTAGSSKGHPAEHRHDSGTNLASAVASTTASGPEEVASATSSVEEEHHEAPQPEPEKPKQAQRRQSQRRMSTRRLSTRRSVSRRPSSPQHSHRLSHEKENQQQPRPAAQKKSTTGLKQKKKTQ